MLVRPSISYCREMEMNVAIGIFIVSCACFSVVLSTCETPTPVSIEPNKNCYLFPFYEFIGNLSEDVRRYLNNKNLKLNGCETEDGRKPVDCADVFDNNRNSKSGIYTIWPLNRVLNGPVKVLCDMEDGGGWTVIQRRGDFDSPQDYFYRGWADYKSGFGDLKKDFWLGNDNIFALTNQKASSIKFVLTDWERNKTYAVYDNFWLDNENQNYTVHVNGYRGTAGDSFSGTNDAPYTTKDRDNDKDGHNCAVTFKGAWWYTACHASNLNGYYLKGPHESYADGVEWHGFRGHYYSLKDSFIKIRPKEFVTLDVTPQ